MNREDNYISRATFFCMELSTHGHKFGTFPPPLQHETLSPQHVSLARNSTRQEMFFLADACRITTGPHKRHNIHDTLPNRQAKRSAEQNPEYSASKCGVLMENVDESIKFSSNFFQGTM